VVIEFAKRLRHRLKRGGTAAWLAGRGLRLGDDVYLAPGVTIDPDFCWLVSLGDQCTVAPGVRILAHDASTKRHIGYSRVARVEIGRRVFIGADSLVLPGVTVGDDAIIGAGSVVNRDVPAGMVVAGNPATVVASTADYVRGHRDRLERAERFHRERFTVAHGVTDEAKREMWERLEREAGYVH
jgi:maltose O-acetyltransferase